MIAPDLLRRCAPFTDLPQADLEAWAEQCVEKAFPVGATPDEVMPDRHVRADAPPHLLLVAENDDTVYPQNALNMEAALKRAGVPVTRTVLPKLNHITIIAAMARPLTFLGGTRQAVIDFIEAHRLP